METYDDRIGTLEKFIESMDWAGYWCNPLPAKEIYKLYGLWIKKSGLCGWEPSSHALAHALRLSSRNDNYVVMVSARTEGRPPKYIPCRRYREAADEIIKANEI